MGAWGRNLGPLVPPPESTLHAYINPRILLKTPFSNEALRESMIMVSVMWLIRSALVISFLGFLLGVTQRYFNRPSKFHRHLASQSYRMYLLHIIVLVPVQFVLLYQTALSSLAVFLVSSVLGITGTYLLSALVGFVTQLPQVERQDEPTEKDFVVEA